MSASDWSSASAWITAFMHDEFLNTQRWWGYLTAASCYVLWDRLYPIRDRYVVQRSFFYRVHNEMPRLKSVERGVKHNVFHHIFDEYAAARAFFDLQEGYIESNTYGSLEAEHSLFVVSGRFRMRVVSSLTTKVSVELLHRTPFAKIDRQRKEWAEELGN